MAQKKCPKCGEDNPSEAVMCWACYTPLTGAAAAAASAAPAPTRAAATPTRPSHAEEKDKKPISPGLVGALALVVLVGLAAGLTQLMTPAAPMDTPPPILKDDDGYTRPPTTTNVSPGQPAPQVSTMTGGASVSVPPPKALPFQPVVLPNPRSEWGTMGIVPERSDLGPTQAAALAAFTLRQYSKEQMQQWKRFYIFVFKDRETARVFSAYLNERRGVSLVNSDYEELYKRGVWNNTLVRYEYRNQREKVLYPQKNPGSWWLDKSAGPV